MKLQRKLLALALAISVVATPVISVAAAAPKAGAACSKKGKTQVASGKLFTCVVKGKKLVWNAGVKVSTSPANPSPSPSTPAVAINHRELDTCDSKSSDWVIGADGSGKLVYLSCGPDNKLHPENGAPAIDQTTGKPIGGTSAGGQGNGSSQPAFDKSSLALVGTSCAGTKNGRQIGRLENGGVVWISCSPDGIWRYMPFYRASQSTGLAETVDYSTMPSDIKDLFNKAWASLRAVNNPGKPAPLTIVYDASVPQWHRDIFEASKKVMLEKFGNWSVDGKEMFWIVASTPESAIQYVRDYGKKLGASQAEIDDYIGIIKGSDRWTTATFSSGQNGSLGGHPFQLFNSWEAYGGNPLFDYHAATHEIFHPLMFQIVPAALRNQPCWINEGTASFVGDAVLDPTGKYTFESLIERQFFHGGGYTQGHPELVHAINTEKSPSQFCGEVGGYMEGDQIVTILVGLYGWDKLVAYLTDKAAANWQEAFKNTYGITKDEFYVTADGYLQRIRDWAVANHF